MTAEIAAPGAGLHVVVLVKQVPEHQQTTALDAAGRLIRDGVPAEMNPFCRRAVAHAVRIAADSGGTSTALTMGPPSAADVLREAEACGIDRTVHLSDPELAGSDCLATARALGAALATLPAPDLVIVGRNSVDADTATIGPMVAEALGMPFIGPALTLTVTVEDRRPAVAATLQQDDAEVVVEVRGPAVVAVAERSISPARATPQTWPAEPRTQLICAADLGAGPWGLAGSGTVVAAVREVRGTRRAQAATGPLAEQITRAVDAIAERGTFTAVADSQTDGTPVPPARAGRSWPLVLALLGADALGRRALLGEAAMLADRVGGHVVAVGDAADTAILSQWGADSVLQPSRADPRPLAAALAGQVPDAWAVLGPATAWAREVLARLSIRLQAGIVADAVALDIAIGADGLPHLLGVKPSGGNAVADIVCCTTCQLATVRTGCLPLRAPRPPHLIPVRQLEAARDSSVTQLARRAVAGHDALDRATSVIGVGRGVDPDDYRQLEPLRSLLRAELAATRPVTDAGWLPHGRQVGITARNIAPQLYLAVGISGSTNHTTGIQRAHTVLAINTDEHAAIFGVADIGIVADWRQAMPLLTQELLRRGLAPA